MRALPPAFDDWFSPARMAGPSHQQATLERAGAPALLLVAPTGGGETLAGFLPFLAELADGAHRGLHTLAFRHSRRWPPISAAT